MALSPAEKQRRYRERLKSLPSTPASPATAAPVPNAGAMRWPNSAPCRSIIETVSTSSRTRCATRPTENACRSSSRPTSRPSRRSSHRAATGGTHETWTCIECGNVTVVNGRQPAHAAGITSGMSPRSQGTNISKAECEAAWGQPQEASSRTPAKTLHRNMDAVRKRSVKQDDIGGSVQNVEIHGTVPPGSVRVSQCKPGLCEGSPGFCG